MVVRIHVVKLSVFILSKTLPDLVFQEEPTIHIARMLVVNQTLCELHLGKHEMTDTGVERLCEALQVNKSLRYLDLRWYLTTYTSPLSLALHLFSCDMCVHAATKSRGMVPSS